MLMPSLFGENMLDDFFEEPLFRQKGFSKVNQNVMSTDVKEVDNGYEIDMNLPGFSKDDVTCELKDGYLTVNASTKTNNDEKGEDGKYLRRERYYGTCSRSFYVGDSITEEDIKAKFENGVLKLSVPKKEPEKIEEQKHYVMIE